MRRSRSGVQVRCQVHINAGQFFKSIGLWFVGILINLIPVLFRCLDAYFDNTKDFELIKFFWTDQDFLFISFSTGFLLFIEVMFVGLKYRVVTKVIGGILLLYTFSLIIIYTISFFSEEWNEHISPNIVMDINMLTFFSILVLGFLVFLFSATDFNRRVVHN